MIDKLYDSRIDQVSFFTATSNSDLNNNFSFQNTVEHSNLESTSNESSPKKSPSCETTQVRYIMKIKNTQINLGNIPYLNYISNLWSLLFL